MVATVAATTPSTGNVVTLPAGIQAGDVITLIGTSFGGNPSALAGYTLAVEQDAGNGSGQGMVWWKAATGSESGTVVNGPSGGVQLGAVILRGASTTVPFGTPAAKEENYTQTHSFASPSVSAAALVLWIDAVVGGDATGMTDTFTTRLMKVETSSNGLFVGASSATGAGTVTPPSTTVYTNYLSSAMISLPVGGTVVTTAPTLTLAPNATQVQPGDTVRVAAAAGPDVAHAVTITGYSWAVTGPAPLPTLEGASSPVVRLNPTNAGTSTAPAQFVLSCTVTDSAGKTSVARTTVTVKAGAWVANAAGTVVAARQRTWAPPVPRFFSGIWTTPLAANAPLQTTAALNGTADTSGVSYATRIAHQAAYGPSSTPVGNYGDGYNTVVGSGTALFVIPSATHARQRVYVVQSGTVESDTWANGLAGKFASVPVPVGADGSRFETYYNRVMYNSGPDKHCCIYNPATDEMWEFYGFDYNTTTARYECYYGGYIPTASSAPEAMPYLWGARATSLPVIGGMLMHHEYDEGAFRHPVQVTLPVIKSGFLAPATRQDGTPAAAITGNDRRDEVPEGAMFRLPASFTVDATKSRLWQMIVTAARDYGMIVTDGSGGSTLFNREGDNALDTPYAAGPGRMPEDGTLYIGSPANVAQTFPWTSLVQLAYVPPAS